MSRDAWHWKCTGCSDEATVAGLENAMSEAEAHSEFANKLSHPSNPSHVVMVGPGEFYEDAVARIIAEAEQIIGGVR